MVSRGIPLDSRQLDVSHLRRIAQVDQAMISYLGMLRFAEVLGFSAKSDKGIDLAAIRLPGDKVAPRPYSFAELIHLHRINLDKVGASWRWLLMNFPGGSESGLVKLVRTGVIDSDIGEHVRDWGRIAVCSWGEIVRLSSDELAKSLVENKSYRTEILDRVRSLGADDAFPVGSLPASCYLKLWESTFSSDALEDGEYRKLFGGSSRLTGRELIEVYGVGSAAYYLTGRDLVEWIWPILAQGDIEESTEISSCIIDLVELARTWYVAIERKESLNSGDENAYKKYRRGVADARNSEMGAP